MLKSASRGVSAPGLGVSGPGGGLPWSEGVPCSRGGSSAQGGVCSRGVLPGLGGSLPGPGGISQHALRQTPLPPCGQTDACENITLAQLRCGR